MPDDVIRSALPRYGRVPRPLLRHPDISARAKVLYGLLDDYAGPEGKAFPSRATLGSALGCSTDSVDRAVKELEAHGWLHREVRRRGDRSYDSTLYTLLAGPVDEVVDNLGGGGRTGAASGRTGAEGVAAPVRTEGEPREGDTPHTPPKGGQRDRRKAVDGDPAWDSFWSLYPRKTGKGAARSAWPAAVDKVGGDAGVLIAAARKYAGSITEVRYACHPATWLRQERWLDDLDGLRSGDPNRRVNWRRGMPECPIHAAEHADSCRGCAADAKAAQ